MKRLRADNEYSQSNSNQLDYPRSLAKIILGDRYSKLFKTFKANLPLIAGITLGVTAIVGVLSALQQPQYRGKFHLLIDGQNDSESLAKLENSAYATTIEILRSPQVIEPIIADLALKYPDLNYQKLIASARKSPLQIQQLKNTGILEISYRDKDPTKIKDILDTLTNGYLKYSLQLEQKEFARGIKYLEIELAKVAAIVENLQNDRQKLREKYGYIEPKKQVEILEKELIELERQYFNERVKLNEQKNLYQILQRQVGHDIQTAIAVSYLTESERYQKLLDRLQEIEIKIAKGAAIWQENSPFLASLKDKKAQLLPLLQQQARATLGNNLAVNLNNPYPLISASALRLKLNQQFIVAANEVEILQLKIKALSEAITILNQKIQTMPQIISQYDRIATALTQAKQTQQRLQETRSTLQLEAAKQTTVWQPLSTPAIAGKSSSSRNLSLGLVSGLLLGSIVVFRSLKAEEDRSYSNLK